MEPPLLSQLPALLTFHSLQVSTFQDSRNPHTNLSFVNTKWKNNCYFHFVPGLCTLFRGHSTLSYKSIFKCHHHSFTQPKTSFRDTEASINALTLIMLLRSYTSQFSLVLCSSEFLYLHAFGRISPPRTPFFLFFTKFEEQKVGEEHVHNAQTKTKYNEVFISLWN